MDKTPKIRITKEEVEAVVEKMNKSTKPKESSLFLHVTSQQINTAWKKANSELQDA